MIHHIWSLLLFSINKGVIAPKTALSRKVTSGLRQQLLVTWRSWVYTSSSAKESLEPVTSILSPCLRHLLNAQTPWTHFSVAVSFGNYNVWKSRDTSSTMLAKAHKSRCSSDQHQTTVSHLWCTVCSPVHRMAPEIFTSWDSLLYWVPLKLTMAVSHGMSRTLQKWRISKARS